MRAVGTRNDGRHLVRSFIKSFETIHPLIEEKGVNSYLVVFSVMYINPSSLNKIFYLIVEDTIKG